ncbi:MAG TPA: aspartate aminotransferase family protein [Roseiflexaceae bacterium]|nr:aspartate aminotransferase family protein [Roseiflexaceae bacterium]
MSVNEPMTLPDGFFQPFAAAADLIAAENSHTSGVYPKRGLAIVRGRGARLWDADGREYIDCVGGQGSANLGHAHPLVTAAITAQAATLISCTEIFHNDQRAAYAGELTTLLPDGLSRLFLCNSGAEAIEGAFKFARLLTGRSQIIATVRGFHGRTMGALSATYEPKYREPFAPLVPGFQHVPYDRLDELAAAVDSNTAAVILEPIQGEGGVRVPSPGYLAGAAQICREHGALLIVDEVQTGFGRTGTMFAVEQSGVIPDIMVLAKSIAAGLPMGAIAIHERFGPLPPASHGSTFGGGPLVCAAARATLLALTHTDLVPQAAAKGHALRQRLAGFQLAKVREVRGQGLLIGIELKERVQPYLVALMERGVLALPAGPNVLRLLPPLVIDTVDLETVADTIKAVLGGV